LVGRQVARSIGRNSSAGTGGGAILRRAGDDQEVSQGEKRDDNPQRSTSMWSFIA
jgi:hypothetical protein